MSIIERNILDGNGQNDPVSSPVMWPWHDVATRPGFSPESCHRGFLHEALQNVGTSGTRLSQTRTRWSHDDHAMIRDQTSLSSLWHMPFHSTPKLNWSLSALSVPYVCLVLLSGLRLWCPYGTQHGWHECLYAKSLESAANDVKTILDMSKLLEDAWSQLEVPFLRV